MITFKPTVKQQRALDTLDRSVCVRAGAGTGKTTVLVGRYMELLRTKRATVREIAALTYTEKAAKVMKDRIRRQCHERELAADDPDDAAWWRRQRIDLETAHIGTIHGFCSHLLGEHPVEAGVDPYFTVLDEVEQSILLERCIDDVVRRHLEEEDTEVLALCRQSGLAVVRGMLRELASNRPEAARAAGRIRSAGDAEVLATWTRLLKEAQAAHVDDVLEAIRDRGVLEGLAAAGCSDATDKLEPLRREVLRLAGELAGAASDDRKIELAEKLRDTTDNLRVGSKAKWVDDGLRTVRDSFRTVRDMLDDVPGGGFDRTVSELDERSLQAVRCLIRVHDAVMESCEREKSAGGYLDFDDLLLHARELLDSRRDVRERLRDRIRCLLVDELQDSALIERDIIFLLVRDEETFRRSGRVRILPGRLFVVGDDKQSIYRFRGAEVTVFRELADRLSEEGEVVDLDVSFRTIPRGVAFANDLFGKLLGRGETRRPYESRYIDLAASRTEPGDFLEVMIPEPEAGESSSDARAREGRMIAARISDMVASGEKLVWDAGAKRPRAVTFGDLAVLFRAMTQAYIYEHVFREAGVPYYILAGSGFFRAQEILDMLTALKCVERPRDEVALLGTLRSPLFGISDETLFFTSRSGSMRAGLARAEDVPHVTDDQRQGLIDARDILNGLAGVKNRVPISRLLGEILRHTGYDATLLVQFMGRQKLANVEKLIDLARSFESKGLFTLDEFIRYIERFVEVEARESERAAEEESSNVVRMMSVHRAKGLEFPVVFVADLSHETRARGAGVVFDGDLGVSVQPPTDDEHAGERPVLWDLIRREDALRDRAENLRLLYVALTRARDHLVLSGPVPRSDKVRCWMNILAKTYGLIGDGGVAAAEVVFTDQRHRAPVRTRVPEIPEQDVRRRRRTQWKVLERLQTPTEGDADGRKPAAFGRRRYVEPVRLDLTAKRRFIPSEFAEYRYCPRRYRLSKIEGILPGDVMPSGESVGVDGMRLGTVVHAVLAAWDFADARLDETIGEVLRGAGLAGTAGAEDLRAEAKRMIVVAHRAGLFDRIASSPERLVEYALAARIGDFVIDGKLDGAHRLDDGSFEIVDYKTDRVGPGDVAGKAGHYELQLACYALAFSKSGRDVSRVSLAFVRAGVSHVWDCDEKQLAEWETKLEACVGDIRAGRFEHARPGPCHCGYCGWLCDRERADGDDLDLPSETLPEEPDSAGAW